MNTAGTPAPWQPVLVPNGYTPDLYDNAGVTGWGPTSIGNFVYAGMMGAAGSFPGVVAYDGQRFIGFGASATFSFVQEMFEQPVTGLIPNQAYALSVAMLTDNARQIPQYGGPYTGFGEVEVYFNNALVGTLSQNTSAFTWEVRTVTFTPTVAAASLRFRAKVDPNTGLGSYMAIDDVRLVATPCATLSDTLLRAEFAGTPPAPTGCYFYTFNLTNNSGQTVNSILFPTGGNYTVTPSFIQFGPQGLANGASSGSRTIKICGIDAGDTVNVPFVLFNRANQECCRINQELTFEIEDCFQLNARPSFTCGTNAVSLTLNISPTEYGIGHVFVLPQSGSPAVIMNNGYRPVSIPQYGTQTINFPVLNGQAGVEYCFEVIVHEPGLERCCSRIVCAIFPDCNGCVECQNNSACDPIDFNNDTLFPDDMDLVDFLSVLAGGSCSNAPFCNDIDYNNDGLFPSDADVISFLSVRAGGGC